MTTFRGVELGVEVGVDGDCCRCGTLTKNIIGEAPDFCYYLCPKCQRKCSECGTSIEGDPNAPGRWYLCSSCDRETQKVEDAHPGS